MTLLECLNIAAAELKEGQCFSTFSFSFTADEWEIIKEPDYEGFAKAVLANTSGYNRSRMVAIAKQFNIPMEEK